MSQTKWVEVGRDTDIPSRGSRRIQFEDQTIALFRTADKRVFALADECPHQGGPLSEGIVHGECVTCPLHNWDISLSSGQALGADSGQVTSFPIRVVKDRVQIQLPQNSQRETREDQV